MNPRRLTRSRDRQLAGVAGGMAEYLDIDPTVSRILWIIVILMTGGLALLAYLVLALVMPQASYAPAPAAWGPVPAGSPAPAGGWSSTPYAGAYAAPQAQPRSEGRGFGIAAIVGVVLIVIGAIALADAALPGWVAGALMGPAILLALGGGILVASLRRRPEETAAAQVPATGAASEAAFAAPAYATPAYATPAAPGMPEAPAAPWDVTDTQAVTPLADVPIPTTDEGSRPA